MIAIGQFKEKRAATWLLIRRYGTARRRGLRLNIHETPRSRNTVDPQKQDETLLTAAYPPLKCLRAGENRILAAATSPKGRITLDCQWWHA